MLAQKLKGTKENEQSNAITDISIGQMQGHFAKSQFKHLDKHEIINIMDPIGEQEYIPPITFNHSPQPPVLPLFSICFNNFIQKKMSTAYFLMMDQLQFSLDTTEWIQANLKSLFLNADHQYNVPEEADVQLDSQWMNQILIPYLWILTGFCQLNWLQIIHESQVEKKMLPGIDQDLINNPKISTQQLQEIEAEFADHLTDAVNCFLNQWFIYRDQRNTQNQANSPAMLDLLQQQQNTIAMQQQLQQQQLQQQQQRERQQKFDTQMAEVQEICNKINSIPTDTMNIPKLGQLLQFKNLQTAPKWRDSPFIEKLDLALTSAVSALELEAKMDGANGIEMQTLIAYINKLRNWLNDCM